MLSIALRLNGERWSVQLGAERHSWADEIKGKIIVVGYAQPAFGAHADAVARKPHSDAHARACVRGYVRGYIRAQAHT
eukprot:6181232-Pleurochrysis_carterae.AAC.1